MGPVDNPRHDVMDFRRSPSARPTRPKSLTKFTVLQDDHSLLDARRAWHESPLFARMRRQTALMSGKPFDSARRGWPMTRSPKKNFCLPRSSANFHNVAQTVVHFIDVEDKIFGPITTASFYSPVARSWSFSIRLVISLVFLVIGGLSLMFAFVKVNGRYSIISPQYHSNI